MVRGSSRAKRLGNSSFTLKLQNGVLFFAVASSPFCSIKKRLYFSITPRTADGRIPVTTNSLSKFFQFKCRSLHIYGVNIGTLRRKSRIS